MIDHKGSIIEAYSAQRTGTALPQAAQSDEGGAE
ncbi:hypothetical protein J2S43_005796 [Catenuloplanes nepalensis]|uniref:Uncharacterized protein n=1 Tax=Catenuloplanes nepalensis TaxID=587533 RepID=A0ABT9N0U0_9ACTN|nr:hypothetical protein [Catenuloplanes nepalensis]